MKALVGIVNKDEVLVWSISVTSRRFVDSSSMDTSHLSLVSRGSGGVLCWLADAAISWSHSRQHTTPISQRRRVIRGGNKVPSEAELLRFKTSSQINLNIFVVYLHLLRHTIFSNQRHDSLLFVVITCLRPRYYGIFNARRRKTCRKSFILFREPIKKKCGKFHTWGGGLEKCREDVGKTLAKHWQNVG